MISQNSGWQFTENWSDDFLEGKGEYEEASHAANTGIFLNIINYFVFMLLGLFAARPFISSQTKDPQIAGYGVTYLGIICLLSFGAMFQIVRESES